ncbi:MAG: hypothetical protein M3042_08755 [Actinomycetota bacterium]|nr:hypothetical protein [Actinomycetota bacterium]
MNWLRVMVIAVLAVALSSCSSNLLSGKVGDPTVIVTLRGGLAKQQKESLYKKYAKSAVVTSASASLESEPSTFRLRVKTDAAADKFARLISNLSMETTVLCVDVVLKSGDKSDRTPTGNRRMCHHPPP